MLTHSLLKRFIKDYNLPIQNLQEPYFLYLIDLYDPYLNTKAKLQLLLDTVKQLGSEEKFFIEYAAVKEKIIETIKESTGYQNLNSAKLDEFNIKDNPFKTKDIFKQSNAGKTFCSIDLKKANFQALKYYDSSIVLNCNSYEEFLRNFTDLDYMIESKYIRQVVFGNLNPKKQIKIEQFLTYKLLMDLIDSNIIPQKDVAMLSADEIVFEFSPARAKDVFLIEECIQSKTQLEIDIEVYELSRFENHDFYVKEFLNKKGYELMCIPKIYFAQAFKIYNNMPINDYDLTFFHENKLARFLQTIIETKEEAFDEEQEDGLIS